MPFADYTDHDDCVEANSDKRDPDAYCWAIKQRVEGEAAVDAADISRRRVLEAALDHPDELAAYDPATEQAADSDTQVFRVLADPDDETDYNGNVLGIGIDFPESGVYIDWRREAFPDPLDEPHVSEYGTPEDVKNATGNQIEYVDSYPTVAQESLPASCRRCGDAQRQRGSMLCADCAEALGEDVDAQTADALDPLLKQAVPVAHSEWSVRELDGIAHEMDILSRQAGRGGAVLWASADGAIAYFADLPEKYEEAIGQDAFVPPKGMHDAAAQALEWYEQHPDEFGAGADDGEGVRRARQIVRHYENDEPMAPEYVVEIKGYLARSDGQEGRAELDPDVPDNKPWLDDGYAAHLLWGGDAGLAWAEELVERMERIDEQEQQAIAGAATAKGWQADGPAAPITQASLAVDQADQGDHGLGSITKAGSNEIDIEALPDAYQEAIEADDFYIYGKASIEQFDREDPPHSIKIEMEALEDALDRFFESEDAPGIISLYHDDIPVGVPVRKHTLDEPSTVHLESPDGEVEAYEFDADDTLTTHVEDGDGDGRPELWLLSNIAGDTEMGKEVRVRALEGQLNGYSVTIHRNRDRQTDAGKVVEACDLHAVTIGTSDIVKNAGSTFGVAEYQAFTPTG